MKRNIYIIIFTLAFALLSYAADASTINKPPSSLGLISGLVGHWSFDEADMAGERAYDRSGNSNTGTLTNGPTRDPGRIGQSLKSVDKRLDTDNGFAMIRMLTTPVQSLGFRRGFVLTA